MSSKYLNTIKDKFNKWSIYFIFWKLIIVSFAIVSAYKFIDKIDKEIHADTKYIEKRINDQVTGVREIFTDSYDSIIELINQNRSNQDISDYLKSIEPNNGSDIYISTFIITNPDLTFRTSGQFSTDDRIDKYNKELKGRQYIIETLNDSRNIKIGNIVTGIKSNKLAIPVGMGLLYKNKYIGTILTGIDIDRLTKNIKDL